MITSEIRERIIKMLNEGKTYNEISEECDCSIKTIQRVAKDNNINLLEIAYWDLKNIEKILSRELSLTS